MASAPQDVRLETYHNVEITKKAASLQPEEEVNHEFRLVTCAIEKGWFPPGTVSIEILHSPHSSAHEGVQPDASHLNLSIDSRKKHAHLYLDLEGGRTIGANTTLVAISFTSSAFPTIARRPTLLQSVLMSPDRKSTPLSPTVEPFVENVTNDEDLMITHIPPSPPPLAKLDLPPFVEQAGDVSDEIETPQSQEARKDWFLEAKPLVHHERLTHLPLPIPPHTTPLERFMLDPKRIGPSNASAPSTMSTFTRPIHRRTASSQRIELHAPPVGGHRRVASMGSDLTKRFSASNLLLDQLWQFGPTCGQRSSSAMSPTVFEVGSDSERNSKTAAVVIQKDRLWAPGDVLTVAFMEKAVTTAQMNQQQKVKDTVLEWQKYANIRFKYIDSVEDAIIRISFDLRGGSWSFVGTGVMDVEKSKPTMNLGWIYGDADVADGERGTILHEFGHTLGLLHELQSPDRPKKLALKYDAVIEYYTDALKTSEEEVKAQIWDVFNASDVSNYSEFDSKSVMMYFMPSSLNEEGIKIPPTFRLSEMDKAFMVINYPSMDKDNSIFLGALDTAGIAGKAREQMLEMFDMQDSGAIRTIFNQFCADARARQSGPSPPQDPTSEATAPPNEVSSPISPVPQEPHTAEPEAPPPARDHDELKQDAKPTGNLGIPALNDPPPPSPPHIPEHKPTKPDESAPPKPPIRKRRRYANLHPPERPVPEEPAIPDACAFDSVMAYRSAGQNDEVDYLWRPGATLTYTWTQDADQATAYRKQRVRETFEFYAARVNLAFREIGNDGRSGVADINVHFGTPSVLRAAGWAFCGASALGMRRKRSEIVEWGGTIETTVMLSEEVLEVSEPASDWTKLRETRLLLHQIGHVLGLGHGCRIREAHTSGKTHPTFRDEKSIMLHPPPGKSLDGDWKEIEDYFNHLSPKFVYTPSEMDLAFLGVAYPYAQGHVDDHFHDDIKRLGLPVVDLLKRRELAFSHFGRPEFALLIRNLRIAIKDSSTLFSQYDQVQPPRTILPENPPHIHHIAFKKLAPRSFLEKLRDQLQSSLKLPTGQLFSLQYPGRPHSFRRAEHGTINGTSTQPDDGESDFHLMDELYDVGTIVTSPNGLRLSVVYEQVLNNLVPRLQASHIQFAKRQDQIRKWLSKEVPASDWVKARAASWSTQPPDSRASMGSPSDSVSISRLELSTALSQEYLAAKRQWELERQSLAKASFNGNIHAATHRIARLSVLREAQLAAKHADAVVRGYSHLIRQYIAYLDIKTPSDILQDAKSDLVAGARTSRDGSTKVYAVQTRPVDWKNGLVTNFKTGDLVDHPTFYLVQIEIRSKQVDHLTARLAALPNGSQTALVIKQQKAVETAQTEFDKANASLETAFAPNVVFLAKACTNANHDFVMADFVACATALKLPSTAFLDIERRMWAVTQAQKDVLASRRILDKAQATSSTSMMDEHLFQSTELTDRIRRLNEDITLLSARFQALLSHDTNPDSPTPNVTHSPHSPLTLDDIPILPPRRTRQDLQWQEFVFQDQFETLLIGSLDSIGASSNPTPLFFTSSDSNELNADLDHLGTLQVDVGFRATLVNVDRSNWFHPQIFRQSTSFHHLDRRISWSKWPKNARSVRDLAAVGATEAAAVYGGLNKHLLPAYPVGYMLCKDITIKIRAWNTLSDKLSAKLAPLLATSAGILCFSTNSSDLSTTSGHSYWLQSVSDGCVIRIPGPQILGYMMQFTEPDATTEIPDVLSEGLVA